MCNICRIYEQAKILKNLSLTAFHNVHKVPVNSTTHKIAQFFKGVWGLSRQATEKEPLWVNVSCLPSIQSYCLHKFSVNVKLVETVISNNCYC